MATQADDQHKHDQVDGSDGLLGAKILSFESVISNVAHWIISYALPNQSKPTDISWKLVAFCLVWLRTACSCLDDRTMRPGQPAIVGICQCWRKKFEPREEPNRGGILGAAGLQTAEISCCDAALFAPGFADKPFESGDVGYPEVITLSV
jgi:hypothetical protein